MTAISTESTSTATATTWTIDPVHTAVEFSVKHLMITNVKGRFGAVSGTVDLDSGNFSKSKVDATIDATSIDTRNEQRDNHLRSADFFDVASFPTLHFVSTRIEGDPEGDFRLTGNLTIKGVTREVTFNAAAEGRGGDPWGGQRAGFSATTKIRRSEFGLTWNQALETGGVVVGDEIKIALDVQLIKKA